MVWLTSLKSLSFDLSFHLPQNHFYHIKRGCFTSFAKSIRQLCHHAEGPLQTLMACPSFLSLLSRPRTYEPQWGVTDLWYFRCKTLKKWWRSRKLMGLTVVQIVSGDNLELRTLYASLAGMNIFVAFFVLLLLLAESTPPAASSIPLIGAYPSQSHQQLH